MTRKVLTMMLAVAVGGFSIACGGDDDEDETAPAAAQPTEETAEGVAAAQPAAVPGMPTPITIGAYSVQRS